MQCWCALWADEAGGDVDDFASEGRAAGFGVRSAGDVCGSAQEVWAIAAHSAHAEFAPNDPDGKFASGPSIRSENTVSTMAWPRWVRSAVAVGRIVLVKNG